MLHLPNLIQDLALILVAAGIVSVIFKLLKQPVVLGYILVGLLVGPKIPLLPTIIDLEGIKVWGEIGVIFLLFALGLEFSFKKLMHVGFPAAVTALVEVVLMVSIGFFAGTSLGWSKTDSLFLGGILAISSTTIILRALDELGLKGLRFVDLVFGILIVEDLVAIMLMVFLSSVTMVVPGPEMASMPKQMSYMVLKLGLFGAIWFFSATFFIPTLLKKLKNFLNQETLLIVSLGLCFLTVVLTTRAGFSPALGAFVMGSILSETSQAERIEVLINPVKDLFAAVFFVSVGMLIDPGMLYQYKGPIILITLITIAGKVISTVGGALLAKQGLKQSLQSGLALAQIGEFSFIIASLGQTLKVTSEFLYPIAVGVSVITTFTTPYMIKSTEKIYGFLPNSWKGRQGYP